MSEQPTVADYIVRRLAREGITDCFGVAGDFAFKLCDAVARSETVRWIGCSNELDAAYAADGYARVRGCSMLLTSRNFLKAEVLGQRTTFAKAVQNDERRAANPATAVALRGGAGPVGRLLVLRRPALGRARRAH